MIEALLRDALLIDYGQKGRVELNFAGARVTKSVTVVDS
jgi:hypothetical protein